MSKTLSPIPYLLWPFHFPPYPFPSYQTSREKKKTPTHKISSHLNSWSDPTTCTIKTINENELINYNKKWNDKKIYLSKEKLINIEENNSLQINESDENVNKGCWRKKNQLGKIYINFSISIYLVTNSEYLRLIHFSLKETFKSIDSQSIELDEIWVLD